MSYKCELTGVKVQFGNNVSHSHRKTRRRFWPNIRVVKCYSEITGQKYKLNIAMSCLRNIEKAGSFDSYLLSLRISNMSDKAKSIRNTLGKVYKKVEHKNEKGHSSTIPKLKD